MIFQGGILLLAVGIIQILTFLDIVVLIGVSRYFPVGIVLINVCISLLIILLAHREIFKITIFQFLIFPAIISLQLLSL